MDPLWRLLLIVATVLLIPGGVLDVPASGVGGVGMGVAGAFAAVPILVAPPDGPCAARGWAVIDLHEVDLAKDLSRLSRQLARAAADIVTELDSPERTTELADYLEDAVRQLRTRAGLPKVIEPHYGQETMAEQDHTGDDEDLVTTLIEVLTQVCMVLPTLTGRLADTLAEMAHRMDPADIAAGLGEVAKTLRREVGPVARPRRDDTGRHRLRESASGPGWPE